MEQRHLLLGIPGRMQRLTHSALLALVAPLALLPAAAPALAASAAPATAGCERAALDRSPRWTISAAWTPDGASLLVVDAVDRELLRYSPSGRYQGPPPGAVGPELAEFFPTVVKPRPAGMLLELAGGRLVGLDRGFAPAPPIDLLRSAVGGARSLESMFLWHPVGADELVACGDVKLRRGEQGESWSSGFFRLSMAAPGRFEELRPLGIDDPERLYCRLGFPYIAALGDVAYVLVMEEKPRLYRHAPGARALEPLAADLLPPGLERPDLPATPPRSAYAGLMAEVERTPMPVGLYGWGDRLYLLSRNPEGRPGAEVGATAWTLTALDPDGGRRGASLRLPTAARHLVVAPGPERWAFLEKGAVRSLGEQDTGSVLFVPAAQVRDPGRRGLCPGGVGR